MEILRDIFRFIFLGGLTSLTAVYASHVNAHPVLFQAYADCENWITRVENAESKIQLNKIAQEVLSSSIITTTYASPEISIVLIKITHGGTDKNHPDYIPSPLRTCIIEGVDVSQDFYKENTVHIDDSKVYEVGSTWDNVEVLSSSEVRQSLRSISQKLEEAPDYILSEKIGFSHHGKNETFIWCGPYLRFIQVLPDGLFPIKEGEFHRWRITLWQRNGPPQRHLLSDCPSS